MRWLFCRIRRWLGKMLRLRDIQERSQQLAAAGRSRRIAFRMVDDKILYYDIDANEAVYWLRPVGSKGHLERRRVRDAKLAELVRNAASQHAARAELETASLDNAIKESLP